MCKLIQEPRGPKESQGCPGGRLGPCAKGTPTRDVDEGAGCHPDCCPGCISRGQEVVGKGSGSVPTCVLGILACFAQLSVPPTTLTSGSARSSSLLLFLSPWLTHLCPLSACSLTLGFPAPTILPVPTWKVFWGQ